jgi:hypothetical protein
VAGLCLLAGLHVFIYSAAFPFFNNVDELAHFDTVIKYARGYLPCRLEPCSDEMVRDMALYNSSFYFGTTNQAERLPPPWSWPAKQQAAWITARSSISLATNFECSQPPLYYVYAAGWWRMSGCLGLTEGNRLYGLRFIYVPVVMLLVWLGWAVARQVFPDKPFRRLALPAVIAVMPQSAFYAIQNDALSPLFFGLAFLGLLRFWTTDVPGRRLGIITGLALAAAFLSKITNTFPIMAFIVMLAFAAHRKWQEGRFAQARPSLVAFAVCAGLPALAWIIWCKLNFGDFTGSQPRSDYWGWTLKPFFEWWRHPLFTPYGTAKFLNHFLPSFWQGELVWHMQPLSFPLANWIYTTATVGLLVLALAKITLQPAAVSAAQGRVLWMSFFICLSAVAFLVYISIAHDFHDSPYPSRDFPYLVSGRQTLGALIPFLLLFVSGLDNLLERFRDQVKLVVLAALALLMLGVEAASNWKAFFDPYNWFHR